MKMMCLRKDKSSDAIGFFSSHDLAQIMAKRLDLVTFEIIPVDVKFKEFPMTEVHGEISVWDDDV